MFRLCSTDFLLVLVVGCLFLFGSCQEFDPCKNHTVVTGPWRNVGFSAHDFLGYPLCDSGLSGKWTRFTGIGGDVLTEKCYNIWHCGAYLCARLGFAHPTLTDGIVSGPTRMVWGGYCNYYSSSLKVLACQGGFFVYFLSPFPCPWNYALRHSNCSLADCGPLAECVGDGFCQCMDGFQLPTNLLPVNESYGCTDIDECATLKDDCDPLSDCVNTFGSYNCCCHQGYQTPNHTKPSLSNPCKDINECVEEPNICGPNANCSNTVGAHTCTCHPGYQVLPVGSLANISNPCRDIDECLKDICGPNSTCTNTPGNYTCTCQTGYGAKNKLLRVNSSNPCVEINECKLDPPICGLNANCTNTIGSYICDCHRGFLKILLAGTKDPCADVDECVTNNCGSYAMCYNTLGSYYCTCKEGYIASTGFTWKYGVTMCESVQSKISSITPAKGQTPEVTFLASIAQDLGKKSDIILPPGTVTNILSTVLSVSSDIHPEKGSASSGNVANIVLDVSEKLMSTLIEPTTTESRKLVTTPTMEINLQIIGPAWNTTKIPVLNAKGNTMTLDNLASIAEQNNGSAAAVLMSVSGMEKLMSSSFFKSENATEMYSDIVTATLPKTKHKELTEPVNFTMYHKKTFQTGLVTCVYWMENGNETQWSVEGCTAAFSNENYTVCSCTHLSTFAILLQTGGQDNEVDDSLLEMVDLFCMCVGLAFLALAILTFLLCTWNPKVNNTARLHLCICLFLGHLLFLVGVSRTENAVVCAVIAGLLQFIFLAGFVWMLLETVQLFLLVRSLTKVQVIQKEGLKTLYLLLIGYGAPTVVVGVSAAVFPGGYGSKTACWLSQERNFQWSFIGPVAAILALNLVSFGVILWSLQPTLANMKSNVSQSRDTRLIIFKIVAQFFVLGCAWILGFFQSSTLLKYLFIVLNSQQGTFIFIVHCLLNKEVREEYKRWFSCLLRQKEPPGSKGSPNSISTVQE